MKRNYIKLSLKSILSQGHQTIIILAGLSVAISCSIMILLYVQYEISYDKYHENADNIYRLITKQPGNAYQGNDIFAVTPGPLKEALVNEIPEIERSTKCYLSSHTLEYNSTLFTEYGFLYTDTDFLKIFSFPVFSGDPAEALKEPFTLFLTREMASKYFGNKEPIGEKLIADNKYVFTVKGVIESIPDNSHLDFDFLTGFETLYAIRGKKENVEKWSSNSYITYFQLIDNVDIEKISTKLETLYNDHNDIAGNSLKTKLIAEPLKLIHLSGRKNFDPGNNIDIRYIILLSSIGILIILIACFNYMNMATARSFSRGREIGILKVAGAGRKDLIRQFLTETVLLSAGGLIIALATLWFILPVFSILTNSPLTYRMIFEFSTLCKIIALMILTGIFAGIYPAFHMASFSPMQMIKGDFTNIVVKKIAGNIRILFVALQYIISLVALTCAITMWHQLQFIKKTDPGFVRDNIINISLSDPSIRKNPGALMKELGANSQIMDITASSDLPVTIGSCSYGNWEGKPSGSDVCIFKAGIGNNFIDFYDLKVISGRGFSNDFASDTIGGFIINQAAAKLLGADDPVGMRFGFNENMGIVIGVIEDFYFHSLHLAVEPLAFSPIGSEKFREPKFISIKVYPGSISETRQFIEKKLKELSPHYLNPVSVLSDRIDSMYNSDRKLATIIVFSTVLAIILTCLGQYSLSSYTAKRRTREMVIRKVMGARPAGIMVMLAGESAKWIFISLLFAWPISYLLMMKWLQGFAYHVQFSAIFFIISLLASLVISIVSISYNIIRLSKLNPAEMIRRE